MKVIADKTLCCGHARCAAKCPEVFKLDAEGYIDIGTVEVPAEFEERARRGAKCCPERAIRVEDV